MKTKEQEVNNGIVSEPDTCICYKSKLLNKYFDTYEELVEAEKAYQEEKEKKQALVEVKKTRAKEVQDAYLELQKIKRDCAKQIHDAEKKWIELRDEFSKDYNGYHMTYTNIDGKESITFGDLLENFFNLW